MKAVIKVHEIKKQKDVVRIQKVISCIEGIIACEVSLKKNEIQLIYNESFVNVDSIIEELENIGLMVI